ncbi:uncharacterized protein SPPG_09084 [Spizellomyces punctatus DAOM BR117]|uniref:Pyridoxal-dependent decarboxylase domain-containing protein 1 n=1 Tax=Spizellomyces punctatus (strain DAOM BR117) TaxID=645134 RepID=A0A0L0HKD4_SPIPD|nr:uncharacterized protein SPPG_09084 [Spizellomyces punctatus DAOM BR117]KND01289.1 hypothetical protein SPPG_09084 [Spizellomyces punctatus DAOM BR117]|eukprot:XP_016609328.1 hypothetical protein SPPG_09084 [Spizellomyces punctatus DAOM BR117]
MSDSPPQTAPTEAAEPTAPTDTPHPVVLELHPVGPHERRSFDITTLSQQQSVVVSPTTSEPPSRPPGVRRASLSSVLSWLPRLSTAGQSEENNTSEVSVLSPGTDPVIRTPKFVSPHEPEGYFNGHPLSPRDSESSPVIRSNINSTHPKKRVSVTGILGKGRNEITSPMKEDARSANQRKQEWSKGIHPDHLNVGSNVDTAFMRSLEACQKLFLDLLSSSSDVSKCSPVSAELDHPDPLIIIEKVGEIVRKHCVLSSAGDADMSQQISQPFYAKMLVRQVAAIISVPGLVPVHKRVALEKEIESTVIGWIQTALNLSSTGYVQFTDPNADGFSSVASAIRNALLRCIHRNGKENWLKTPELIGANLPVRVIYHADDINAKAFEVHLLRSWPALGTVLGFSKARLRRVPSVQDGETIDLIALDRMVDEDIQEGKKPCMVIARAGTPVTGQFDSLMGLRAICDKCNMWLHVDGMGLAFLVATNVKTDESQKTTLAHLEFAKKADSFVIDFEGWFGISGLPPLTLFRANRANEVLAENDGALFRTLDETEQKIKHTAQPLRSSMVNGRLILEYVPPAASRPTERKGRETSEMPTPIGFTLPFWIIMKTIDEGRLQRHVLKGQELARVFFNRVTALPFLRGHSQAEAPLHVVLVRFDARAARQTAQDSLADQQNPPIFDDLAESQLGTKYIYAHLQDELRSDLDIDLVSVAGILYIRYRPFSSASAFEIQTRIMPHAAGNIVRDAERIFSAIAFRKAFRDTVEKRRELIFVDEASLAPQVNENGETEPGDDLWFGLGAVRYTPLYIDVTADSVAPEVINNLDGLNVQMADQLSELRPADKSLFQSCRAAKGTLPTALRDGAGSCVRIGLASQPFTLESIRELVNDITKTGMKLERNSDFVARIADVIRKGIEEAERQLQNESAEEQPSILRMLPIVGSVLSWWRPEMPKNRVPVAKTFSIATGFTTIPLGPNSPRGSISLPSRQNSVIHDASRRSSEVDRPVSQLSSVFNDGKDDFEKISPVEEEAQGTVGGTETQEETPAEENDKHDDLHSPAAEEKEHVNNPVPDSSDLANPKHDQKLDRDSYGEANQEPSESQPVVEEIENAVRRLIGEHEGQPDHFNLDQIRASLDTQFGRELTDDAVSSAINKILDERGVTGPTDGQIEAGVREILQEYRNRLGELNNRKVRMILQDRFRRDLRDRTGFIREVIDKVLEERG